MKKNICKECGDELKDDFRCNDTCSNCCDHEFDPDEGYTCLNCGLDGSEEVMSRAYDRAKDLRKYGDT